MRLQWHDWLMGKGSIKIAVKRCTRTNNSLPVVLVTIQTIFRQFTLQTVEQHEAKHPTEEEDEGQNE